MRTVMLGLLLLLLAHNVVLLGWNQATFDEWHRWTIQRTALSDIAAHARNPNVSHGTATHYLLHDHIAGTRITLPRALGSLTWELERTARVDVETTDQVLQLEAAAAKTLNDRASHALELHILGRPRPISFVFEQSASHYVLAHTESHSQLFVVPETLWASLASESRTTAPLSEQRD